MYDLAVDIFKLNFNLCNILIKKLPARSLKYSAFKPGVLLSSNPWDLWPTAHEDLLPPHWLTRYYIKVTYP